MIFKFLLKNCNQHVLHEEDESEAIDTYRGILAVWLMMSALNAQKMQEFIPKHNENVHK